MFLFVLWKLRGATWIRWLSFSCGTVGQGFEVPYVLPHRINGAAYRPSFKHTFRGLMESRPLDIPYERFKHNGAAAHISHNKQTNFVALVRERTIYTERQQFLAKLVPTFADRGCGQHNGSLGRILDFLDRSRYFFFQVAPQLYSRGWVDPVPDPLLLRKSGRARNRTQTCGSVAKNSDHYTTVTPPDVTFWLPTVGYR
jgi:hypothetical protein